MIVNQSLLTKEKNLKFSRDLYSLRMSSTTFWGIICIILAVTIAIIGFIKDDFVVLCVCLGVFMLLFGVAMLLLPLYVKFNADKVFKANADGLDSIQFNFIFEEDSFIVANGKGEVIHTGSYQSLFEVIVTTVAYYVMLEQYFGFVVDFDGFKKGDPDALAELFKQHGIKLTSVKTKKH